MGHLYLFGTFLLNQAKFEAYKGQTASQVNKM